MCLVDISQVLCPILILSAIPARPYRGTSFSSLTTMLRSASLAAFEMLRICCCGARPSKLCRATLRIHDVHWGSSADRLREAIEGCVGVVWSCQQKLQVIRTSNLEILAIALGRTSAETLCLAVHFAGCWLDEQTRDDCQHDEAAVRQQWRIETFHLHIPPALRSTERTSARDLSLFCGPLHHPRQPIPEPR